MNKLPNEEIKRIWLMVFNLSLNFLHDQELAEEVTQEIFLKANEGLSTFRHQCQLSTWVYRIAYNYLVDEKRKRFKDEIDFERFALDVNNFTPYENELNLTEEEMAIYVEQIKVGCTKAMLQCLDETDRFVFILGKLFEFSSKEGASICAMTEDAYRQRLSRATRKITAFMTLNCGLLSENATCRCKKRIGIALQRGRIDADKLLHHTESKRIRDYLEAMNDLDAVAAVFRETPFLDKEQLFTGELRETASQLAAAI